MPISKIDILPQKNYNINNYIYYVIYLHVSISWLKRDKCNILSKNYPVLFKNLCHSLNGLSTIKYRLQ